VADLGPDPLAWLHHAGRSSGAPTPAGYPPFSWDTVPIAADFGKAPDQFTQEEGLFIARHFSLVSIEKGQAVGPSTKRPPYTNPQNARPMTVHWRWAMDMIFQG
jgi:hypothetical protein